MAQEDVVIRFNQVSFAYHDKRSFWMRQILVCAEIQLLPSLVKTARGKVRFLNYFLANLCPKAEKSVWRSEQLLE